MMHGPFWKSTKILFRFKRLLILALVGALVSAGCFGAGLTMILPTIVVLLGDDKGQDARRKLIDEMRHIGNAPEVIRYAETELVKQRAAEKTPLERFIADKLAPEDSGRWRQDLAAWLTANLPHDPFEAFVLIMVIIAGLTVIGSLGRYMHELFMLTIILRAAITWRARMFRRLVQAPMLKLMQQGTADHISRVVTDSYILSQGYQSILGKTLAEVLKGAAALTAAFFVNPLLAGIAVAGALPMGLLLRTFGRRIRRATRRALRQRGKMIARLKESLDSLHVVKVHEAEGYERRRFGQVNRALFKEEMKVRRVRALSSPLIETLTLLGVALIACMAAWLIFRREQEALEFITVLVMLGAAGRSLKLISNMNNQIAEAGAAAERIFSVVDELPVEPIGGRAGRGRRALVRHSRAVCFDEVGFAYPGQDRPAISDVNLEVPFGSTVAIVGGNGAGKTTLLNLLPRLIEPSLGRVLVDNVNISAVNLRSLRRQIAVVSQQSVLFAGTIAQNVAYGRREAPMSKIVEAAKAAFAHEFVSALPGGYDAVLGEGGTGLSGGQRQRLCIARAILRDPAILILDEATSQIDADSEAQINQALGNLRHGRTIFIIAHRLSTVVDADQIVVMNLGTIADLGTHDELLERCVIYQTLTQHQFVSPARPETDDAEVEPAQD